MTATPSERLLVGVASPVHRLAPEVKIVVLLAFVIAVVATPRDQIWAFCCHLLLLAGAVAVARLPLRLVARRMLVELPVVVFALLLPLVASGDRVSLGVGPLAVTVSGPGLAAAVALLAKATLGVGAAVVLAATTPVPALVGGLRRLGVPVLFVTVLHFMIRYVDVVAGDLARMRIAQRSRGFRPRHLGHAPVLARAAAALFVRTYERGERVHRAMLARGSDGVLPPDVSGPPRPSRPGAARLVPLTAAAALPAAATVVAVAAAIAPASLAWQPGG